MYSIKYILLLLVFVISLFGDATVKKESQKSTIPVVVSVSWLKEHYENPNIVIVDVRKESVFEKGHLKHAINMPVFKDLFDKNYMMPKLHFLKNLFSNAGIDNNSLVVVYGNNEPIWAARFYWISKVLGHNKVGLLKVSYGNWQKGTLPISSNIYKAKKSNFIPRIDNSIFATKLDTLIAVKSGNKIIIDGRPNDFFMGQKSMAKRFGHIPNAINLSGARNFDKSASGSRIKDFTQLQQLYADLPKNKHIILYCQDGADAALNFLVLNKMGYKASVYDGSWLEWGNDFSLPYINPSKNK